ncbi:unnamed protein product, partial [Nesidiocoris tenuis]
MSQRANLLNVRSGVNNSKKNTAVVGDQDEDDWYEGKFSQPAYSHHSETREPASLQESGPSNALHETTGEVELAHEVAEADGEDEGASFQGATSSTFSEYEGRVDVMGLKSRPAYRSVAKYVKLILTELVNKNTENVTSHFEEWSFRVLNDLENTYGVPQEVFMPTAHNYLQTLKSFTYNWKNAIEEYLHEYGPEVVGEGGLVKRMNYNEEEGEGGVMTVEDVIIKDDDWEEGGYKHYLDRKAEPKERPFDEFKYVTIEQFEFLNEVGIGLSKPDQYEIHMAMQRLAAVRYLPDVKFWGKIYGLYQDYYIAEAVMRPEDMQIEDFINLPEYTESDFVGEYCGDFLLDEEAEGEVEPEEIGDLGRDIEEREMGEEMYYRFPGEYGGEEQTPEKNVDGFVAPTVTFDDVPAYDPVHLEVQLGEEEIGEQESVFELDVDDGKFIGKWTLKTYKLPELPMIVEKPIKPVPMEKPGEGTNKHVFFVTNDPKSDWIRLPHVTPEQIVVGRQIRKFFTGYLTSRVNSWPKFPGIEMNLLRVQIARISAGTQVSPAGYYRFEEGEEAVEPADVVAGKGAKIELNRDFDPLTVDDLTDPTGIFWTHHTEHILQQGRTVWYNVNQTKPKQQLGEGLENAEDEFEEGPLAEEVVGEIGPALLTSCSQDLFMEAIPPWTVKTAIELAPHEGASYIRSNLWPGSYSFAFGKK